MKMAARQRARFQAGASTLERFTAMTNITMPVVVQSSSASTDDSTPKAPPVNQSGPFTVDRIKPCWASLPETTPEKMADCVFQRGLVGGALLVLRRRALKAYDEHPQWRKPDRHERRVT